MAYVKFLVHCESSGNNFLPDGTMKTIINQPLTSISVEFVPTLFSFAIAIGICDVDDTTLLQLKIKNAKSKEIITDTGPMPISLPPEALFIGEILAGVNVLNAKIENLGEYITEVYLNRKIAGEYPITVRRLAKNGGNSPI